MILALVCAVLSLLAIGAGLFSMTKNQEFREKYTNKLMKARVVAQGFAVLFLVLAFVSGS